jgi:hypothetical protein
VSEEWAGGRAGRAGGRLGSGDCRQGLRFRGACRGARAGSPEVAGLAADGLDEAALLVLLLRGGEDDARVPEVLLEAPRGEPRPVRHEGLLRPRQARRERVVLHLARARRRPRHGAELVHVRLVPVGGLGEGRRAGGGAGGA